MRHVLCTEGVVCCYLIERHAMGVQYRIIQFPKLRIYFYIGKWLRIVTKYQRAVTIAYKMLPVAQLKVEVFALGL
jgi:hypothetical protein